MAYYHHHHQALDVEQVGVQGVGTTTSSPPRPAAAESPVGRNGTTASSRVIVVENLDFYDGATVQEKVADCIQQLPVVVVTNTWCPFSKDALHVLSEQLKVTTYVIHVNEIAEGDQIFKHLSAKENHKTVPMIYVRGRFLGGCDSLHALHERGDLDKKEYLHGLIGRRRTMGTCETLETSRLRPPWRGHAILPFFWYPPVVDHRVVRLTALLVFILSAVSVAFHGERWGHCIAYALLVDFLLRLLAGGSSVSPLGMIATVAVAVGGGGTAHQPDFGPGAPQQFAAFCGVLVSVVASLFYVVQFAGHEYVGAAFMGLLAAASGIEGKKTNAAADSMDKFRNFVFAVVWIKALLASAKSHWGRLSGVRHRFRAQQIKLTHRYSVVAKMKQHISTLAWVAFCSATAFSAVSFPAKSTASTRRLVKRRLIAGTINSTIRRFIGLSELIPIPAAPSHSSTKRKVSIGYVVTMSIVFWIWKIELTVLRRYVSS